MRKRMAGALIRLAHRIHRPELVTESCVYLNVKATDLDEAKVVIGRGGHGVGDTRFGLRL